MKKDINMRFEIINTDIEKLNENLKTKYDSINKMINNIGTIKVSLCITFEIIPSIPNQENITPIEKIFSIKKCKKPSLVNKL